MRVKNRITKNFLIVLSFLLLTFLPAGADYTINVMTGLMDYYEPGLLPAGAAAGDVPYFDGTDWQILTAGANGLVLTLVGGLPTWIASGGAPLAAQYLVLANDGVLTAERRMLAGTGISFTDTGANGNLTIWTQDGQIDHDSLLNYVAGDHIGLPSTIAVVLTDHDLAAHTALGLFDQHADVDHDQTTNYLATEHFLEGTIDHGSILGLADKDHALNGIANPTGNVLFNMTTRQIRFNFTNPAVADGGVEIEASGAFSGDLMHVHQHTGNPGATDLLHLEADDTDVVPLRVDGVGTYDIISGDISAPGIDLTGELDITGVNTFVDLNPAGTGTKDIIDITPSAALVAGAVWHGIDIDATGLDPLTGAASTIHGYHFEAVTLASVDGDASIIGFHSTQAEGDSSTGFSNTLRELTANKVQNAFRSFGGTPALSATGTYNGLFVDWDGVTRDGGAPVLHGVNIMMPADYSSFGVSYGGYFSGDGRSVTITDTTYALNVSGDVLMNDTVVDKLECNEAFTFDAFQTAAGDGDTTIDWGLGNFMYFTFGAQNEIIRFTAPPGSAWIHMIVKQDGVGSRTIDWSNVANLLWPGNVEPTLSAGAAAVDIVSFIYDGTSWHGLFNGDFR